MKAILERKQAEDEARSAPPARPRRWLRQPALRRLLPWRAERRAGCAGECAGGCAAPAAVAPRRIVPLPRQAPDCDSGAAPAIASKPPVGPVIARPPVVVAAPQRQRLWLQQRRWRLRPVAAAPARWRRCWLRQW